MFRQSLGRLLRAETLQITGWLLQHTLFFCFPLVRRGSIDEGVTDGTRFIDRCRRNFPLFYRLLRGAWRFTCRFEVRHQNEFVGRWGFQFRHRHPHSEGALLLATKGVRQVFPLHAFICPSFYRVLRHPLTHFLLTRTRRLGQHFRSIFRRHRVTPRVRILRCRHRTYTRWTRLVFVNSFRLAIFITRRVSHLTVSRSQPFAQFFRRIGTTRGNAFPQSQQSSSTCCVSNVHLR